MRTLVNYMFVALLTVSFFGCEKDVDLGDQDRTESLEAAESEASMEEMSDDVDEIAFYGSEFAYANGRTAHDEESPLFCADITHDPINKTIIIDYGDGCEDKRGRIREGKIIITYTTLLIFPGAEVTVTFEDFYISDVKIEGVRTIKNISDSLEDTLTFEVTFENGKFTWEDGSVATRNAHWTLEWIRASNPINDEKHLEGSASGTTKAGVEYSVEITETLIFKRECRPWYVFFPVQGVKVVTWNDRTKVIDYGDGECDRLVNITSEGIKAEVELKTRFRWRNG